MKNIFELSDGLSQIDGGIFRMKGYDFDVFKAMSLGKKACEYIYVVTSDNDIYYYETRLIAYNFDRINGSNYASYQIKLDFHDLSNKNIIKVGFAFDKNEQTIISECNVNYKKNESSRLIISGIVYLNEFSSGINSPIRGAMISGGTFSGGDNPFIKALLGAESFDSGALKIKNGLLNTPLIHFERENDFLEDELNFNLEFFDGGMRIITSISENAANEIVLIYKDIPCARFLPLNTDISIDSIMSSQNGQVIIGANTVAVSNIVLSGGNRASNFNIFFQPARTTLVREEKFSIGAKSKIISDPNRNYFAVLDFINQDDNIAQITQYEFIDNRLIPIAFNQGLDASCCIDGSLVVYKEDTIEITNFERNTNSHMVLNIKSGQKNETAFLNGSFVIVTLDGSDIKIYSINQNGEIFNERQHTYDTDNLRLVNFFNAISVVALGEAVRSYTPFAMGSEFDAWLTNNNVANFIRSDNPVFESGRLVGTNINISNSRRIEPFAATISTVTNARLMDDYLFMPNILGGSIQPLVLGDDFRIRDIGTNFGGINKMYNNQGNLIVFCGNGKILIYVFEPSNLRLVANGISSNDVVHVTRTSLVRRNGAVSIEFNKRR
ncbi:MAG: hypothetical protein FWE03_01470 [Firmicutes bacterium]|nr:hypothetical protein [Bacillota bacterium]